MQIDNLLKQGITALKSGQKAQARSLLEQVVQQDERNELAWLWLSGAVDTDEERRLCLENVLLINPDNDIAKQGIKQLNAHRGIHRLPVAANASPKHQSSTRMDSLEQVTWQHDKQPLHPSTEKQVHSVSDSKNANKLSLVSLLVGVMVICLIGIAVLGGWYAANSGLFPLQSKEHVATIPATATVAPDIYMETILKNTLGNKYTFEQSYIGSVNGAKVLFVEAHAAFNDMVSPKAHIPFFIEALHAYPNVAAIKITTFSIEYVDAYTVRATDIVLYEQGKITDVEFIVRWQ